MSSNFLENSPLTSRPTAERLLILIKTRGPQTAAELAAAVGITGEAARQQLVKLAEDGFVSAASMSHGVGRPVQVWNLPEMRNFLIGTPN